jgi:DegV family protein with EDD domain
MSKKIAIVSCSNSCIDYFEHPYDIAVFRSSLHLGGEDFLDYVDISAEEFYQRLIDNPSLFPSSSYMPLGQMIEILNEKKQQGYDTVIIITISKEMSGIYNASLIAGEAVDGLDVIVFDSKTLAYPQAKMVLTAAKMASEEESVSEILQALEHIRDNNKIYFTVHTLDYLVKNGRLSGASGYIGNKLKIKPLLTITQDGFVETVEKIRTFHKAVSRMMEIFFEEIEPYEVEVFITHANNPETKDKLIEMLSEKRPEIKKIHELPLTAVVGAHAGPKTIGIGYIKVQERKQ